jgi:integrase
MPRANRTLTKTIVENVAPAAKGDVFEWDRDVRGFGVRVSPQGKRTFIFQFRSRNGSQQRRLTLGTFPALTVDKARGMARDAYETVRRGDDPAAQMKAAKPAPVAPAPVQTLGGALDEFLRRYTTALAPHTRKEYEGVLGRYVVPALADVPLYDVRRRHIVGLLDDVEAKGGPVLADRTLKYLRRAFTWLAVRDDDFTSPIVRGMSRTRPRERARDRTLDDDEIRALWKTTEGDTGIGALCRLILLSAQRPGECASIRPDRIKDGVWEIPAASYKTGIAHAVPLSKPVLDIIAAQPVHADGRLFSPWVQKSGKAKAALDKVLPIAPWVLHDLRRTARTLMSRAGVNANIAERVLGHVIAGVAGVYDRHDYLAEKRDALAALAAQVDRILHPVENVVVLNRVAEPVA